MVRGAYFFALLYSSQRSSSRHARRRDDARDVVEPCAANAAPATSADEKGPWARAFAAEIAGLRSDGVTYADSAAFLRALVAHATLKFTDIRDDPRKFFLAHRLLAKHAPEHGPGFWIRFTVQFNLFAGTVVALGGPEQLAELDAIQRAGQLGCFCLTERLAGVNSGLVVNTLAEWDPELQTFVIDSPTDGAYKNWISQDSPRRRRCASRTSALGESSRGPHAFHRPQGRRDRPTLPGVVTGDMGKKTTGVDLDNAWVRFDKLRVGRDRLLNRYGEVLGNEYVAKAEGGSHDGHDRPAALHRSRRGGAGGAGVRGEALRGHEKIQRREDVRHAGGYPRADRRAAAPSAVRGGRGTTDEGEKFRRDVRVSTLRVPRGRSNPARGPHPRHRGGEDPSRGDSHRAVLPPETGGGLLRAHGRHRVSALRLSPVLQVRRGDSRILSQKLARDAFAQWNRTGGKSSSDWSRAEVQACENVAAAVRNASSRGAGKTAAWDAAWRDVYALADAICERVIDEDARRAKL